MDGRLLCPPSMRSPFPLSLTLALASLAPPSQERAIRTPPPKAANPLPSMPSEALENVANEERVDRETANDGIIARAQERRVAVSRLLFEGAARTSDDFVHAAYVFQFSETEADLTRAHTLAIRATRFRLEHPLAKWLAAATEDRLKMFRGEPQKFGTQFHAENGKWALYRVDPRTTDAERRQWGVRPLAEAFEHVAMLNAQRGQPDEPAEV